MRAYVLRQAAFATHEPFATQPNRQCKPKKLFVSNPAVGRSVARISRRHGRNDHKLQIIALPPRLGLWILGGGFVACPPGQEGSFQSRPLAVVLSDSDGTVGLQRRPCSRRLRRGTKRVVLNPLHAKTRVRNNRREKAPRMTEIDCHGPLGATLAMTLLSVSSIWCSSY